MTIGKFLIIQSEKLDNLTPELFSFEVGTIRIFGALISNWRRLIVQRSV